MGQKNDNKQKANSPLELILEDYDNYLMGEKGVNQNSFNNYHNVETIFNNLSKFNDASDAAKLFLKLLPKILVIDKKRFITIERLIVEIKDKDFDNANSNEISYLNKFFHFIRSDITNKMIERYSNVRGDLSLDDNEKRIINDGEGYTEKQLESKFRSRLRTQDRVSGDKIWLPLRYISKIYNRAVRDKKIENNFFNEWIEGITKKVYIYYTIDKSGNRPKINLTKEIKHVELSNVEFLSLSNYSETDNKYEVLITINKNGKLKGPFPVVTPTGRGNEKDYMKVKSIRDIAIDHVLPIDSILRKLENSLSMLKIVSDSYKDLQVKEEPDEESAIGELLVNNNFNLETLRDDLDKISGKGFLRLMASDYNTRKSNGETYKKIIKINKEYKGILDYDIFDENGNKMTLYQDLKDNGKTLVAKSSTIPSKPEVAITKTIIDLI